VIVQEAEDSDADLIVVGTRAYTHASVLFIGSVSTKSSTTRRVTSSWCAEQRQSDLCFTPARRARAPHPRARALGRRGRRGRARADREVTRLNCICFVYPRRRGRPAATRSAPVTRGDEVGPLHGVPIAIKDLTPTQGQADDDGLLRVRALGARRSALHRRAAARGRAIMVGKTTTPEFAYCELH
jgi:hypothetical protein